MSSLISVLYVDDEQHLLELGKIFLEISGMFQVTTSTSALEMLAEGKIPSYDAIISDYQMPEMDGITFLKTVRNSYGNIPFILFTGRGREEVVIEAINSGVDFYIQKGGDPKPQFAELAHKIRHAVQRHKAEQDLARKEANLEAILANTDDIIASYDPEMHLLAYNRACIEVYRKFFGAELRPGICAVDLWPESTRDKWVTLKNRVMTGETFSFEFSLPGPDGKESFFESFYNPIRDNGSVVGFSTFTRNITERKHMEDEIRAAYERITASEEELRQQYDELKKDAELIRESEARFHDLAEMLPQMVYESDAMGRYTYINRMGKQMSQLTDEDIQKGFYIKDHIFPEDLPILAREFQEMTTNRSRATGIFEYRAVRKDGTVCPIAAYSIPIVRNDKVKGFRGIVIDMTEKHKKDDEIRAAYEQITVSEEELRQQYDQLRKDEELIRESEARFRILFESASDAIIIIENGRFVMCNPRTLAVFGCTAQEQLLEKTLLDFSPEYQQDGRKSVTVIREKHRKALTSGSLTFEWLNCRLDGTPFYAEISLNPLKNNNNQVQMNLRDISARKKAEATEILANRKLVIMNDVSRHIIRNKMAGLIGCAEMISEASSKNERFAISKEIKDLIYTIKKQIDFTQEYEKVGMNLPVWKNLKQIISGIDSKGIPVVLAFKDYDIFADPLLENLFNYFIENSIKNGENVTEIRITSQERPDGLVLTYADNGIGIHPSQKLKIFEHHADPRQGVGLLLVREILAITDITITETGVFGEGVRFEMLVPPGRFRCTF